MCSLEHRKNLVRHVDQCTALPAQDSDLSRCNVCTLGIAMGRIVHLHRYLEAKWMKIPPGKKGEHLERCMYQDTECMAFARDEIPQVLAHSDHAERIEHARRKEGPEFSLQTLWRAFRMTLDYIYREPRAHMRNLERRNRYFQSVLQGRLGAWDWASHEMPMLSNLGSSLMLVALVLENDMHGDEHSFYWKMRTDTTYLGEWFPRVKMPDGTTAIAPRSLSKELGWFANTIDYDLGSHESDPLGLLHEFLTVHHEARRRDGILRAQEAFAELSLGLQYEYGARRWLELYGEPPTSGEFGYLIPLGRGLFEMQWELYTTLPVLREPDWYILEALCAPLLLPPADLFNAIQAGTLKREKIRGYLEATRSFICHTLYEPTQTLERMADFLADANHRLLAMARLIASGLPEERVCSGCAVAQLALEAWRQSVAPTPRAPPPPSARPLAKTAVSVSPLDTVDRLACALPDPARVACAQEATPPGAAQPAPHPARDATTKKRRALSTLECVAVE